MATALVCAAVLAYGSGCGSEPHAYPVPAVSGSPPRLATFDSSRKWPQRRHTRAKSSAATPAGRQPAIIDRLIPYGAARRAEMAAYSKRHYGSPTWRLTRPRVIVEHYTGTSSFSAAYNTFAADVRDPELHELPGTCAHFMVDSNGKIYRLVPTGIRCRHTVGLNYTAIGIEHVGTSDAQVMGNRAQLRASLRLTRWLRCARGIAISDVIGHNESLTSPYHHEREPALRHQTHGDMRHSTMNRYRSMLHAAGC